MHICLAYFHFATVQWFCSPFSRITKTLQMLHHVPKSFNWNRTIQTLTVISDLGGIYLWFHWKTYTKAICYVHHFGRKNSKNAKWKEIEQEPNWPFLKKDVFGHSNIHWNKSFVGHRLEMKSTMAFLQMNMIEIFLFSPHWINLIKSHEKWRRGWSAASAFICAWIASLILFSSDRFPLHRLELTFHYRLSWESRQKCEKTISSIDIVPCE